MKAGLAASGQHVFRIQVRISQLVLIVQVSRYRTVGRSDGQRPCCVARGEVRALGVLQAIGVCHLSQCNIAHNHRVPGIIVDTGYLPVAVDLQAVIGDAVTGGVLCVRSFLRRNIVSGVIHTREQGVPRLDISLGGVSHRLHRQADRDQLGTDPISVRTGLICLISSIHIAGHEAIYHVARAVHQVSIRVKSEITYP